MRNFNWIERGFKLELAGTKLAFCDWHDCLIVDTPIPACWENIQIAFSFIDPKRAKQLHTRWIRMKGE